MFPDKFLRTPSPVETDYKNEGQENPNDFRTADGKMLYEVFLNDSASGLVHNHEVQDAKLRLGEVFINDPRAVYECKDLSFDDARVLLLEKEQDVQLKEAA